MNGPSPRWRREEGARQIAHHEPRLVGKACWVGYFADTLVVLIGNQQVARRVHRHAERITQLGTGRPAAVA